MKKIQFIALLMALLVVFLCFTLVSCDDNDDDNQSTTTSTNSSISSSSTSSSSTPAPANGDVGYGDGPLVN